jgi:hypothetical protein
MIVSGWDADTRRSAHCDRAPSMASTFEKLSLKDQTEIVVVNAPRSFEPELAAMGKVAVARSVDGLSEIQFSLAFVAKQSEVDDLGKPSRRKPRVTQSCGSPIPREPRRNTRARSSATVGGTRSDSSDSNRSEQLPLMRIGLRCDSAAPNSSNRCRATAHMPSAPWARLARGDNNSDLGAKCGRTPAYRLLHSDFTVQLS